MSTIRVVLLTTAILTQTIQLGICREWKTVKSWVYQLQGYSGDGVNELVAADFDLAVIDLARDGRSSYFTAEEIGRLKHSGKFVLAYFEIGAIEEFRPEWSQVPRDLLAGKVDGWPDEQYVRYWDKRWWPFIKKRVDRALNAGFDGAYLDLITAYDEIPDSGLSSENRAKRMVDLIVRISDYSKAQQKDFKIVPQNCPELYTWSHWEPRPNRKYFDAVDAIALESVFYLAHDIPANKEWCEENRRDALSVQRAGKLVLGVDYARKPMSIERSYHKQRQLGFVPYASTVSLDEILSEAKEQASR